VFKHYTWIYKLQQWINEALRSYKLKDGIKYVKQSIDNAQTKAEAGNARDSFVDTFNGRLLIFLSWKSDTDLWIQARVIYMKVDLITGLRFVLPTRRVTGAGPLSDPPDVT
jgi:hypothetical protein